MSVPFRERNPVVIGAISLAVVAGLILAAFNAQNLPVIGGGDTYTAAFTEAGGLKANDEVRVAGVRVGKVEKVELDGDHVKVTFRVEEEADFGKETRADIKVKTLLGAMYLSLAPAGSGQLSRDTLAVLAWQELACHPLDPVDLEPRLRHVRRIGWDGASAIDDLGGPRVRLRLARARVLSRKPLII